MIFIKNKIKLALKTFGLDIKKYKPKFNEGKVVSLEPTMKPRGSALLSYIIEPFLLKNGEAVSNAHTHDWESFQIGRTFLDLGYSLDVIDFRDRTFVPKKKYSFFVSARTNFQRIAELLHYDCIKIVHLEASHWLFNNSSVYRRCLDLQTRKGVTLRSIDRKLVEPNLAIEHADYATIKGNDFTISTYSYAKKPYFRTYNPACLTFSFLEDKEYDACRNSFLWFGSEGLVHKGLDLVLEAIINMPDVRLTVCGPIDKEKDFERVYYKELYETSNVRTVGWVNIESPDFIKIARSCIGIVYPSCAEGQSGSVVTCMHTGLIPIVSYESGVDVNDFGLVLNDCSIKEIMKSIRMISDLPSSRLGEMSRKAWEYARTHHTREIFKRKYRTIIETIMADQGDEKDDKN
jgi:glycosyltransferase involved in cell wall biosynthesis